MAPGDLKLFCSKDQPRPMLLEPFTDGAYTYATDGVVCVRITAVDGYRANAGRVDINRIKWPSEKPSGMAQLQIPTHWPERLSEPCGNCDGTGKIALCKSCKGAGFRACGECGYERDCLDCKGRGYEKKSNDGSCPVCSGKGMIVRLLVLRIGVYWFNFDKIRSVLELPGLRVAKDHLMPGLYFTFDGGEGSMMPLRMDKEEKAAICMEIAFVESEGPK